MERELVVAVVGIVMAFYALGMRDSTLMLVAFAVIIGIGMYSGYHFKGQKNCWYALGVFGAFLVFMAMSSMGHIGTIVLLAFFGLVCYLAWHARRSDKEQLPMYQPTERINPDLPYKPGTFMSQCPNCGQLKAYSELYCPRCGSKVEE